MRYGWIAALVASGVTCVAAAGPVAAQSIRYRIDIDASDLGHALAQLSAQTGISVAIQGVLPHRTADRLRGSMRVEDALAHLLGPVGWEAKRVAPHAYRLRARPPRGAPITPTEPAAPDIVVTGRKRSEVEANVPVPIAVYRPDHDGRGAMGAATGTRDVARALGGLTVTEAGPGGERLFLRGVADSLFNGFSQSTVSVQLDDARIAFNGADPALRLIDIARVEVLKGPQGPLYGTGALGGVYRIVTNRPLLDKVEATVGGGVSSVSDGGVGLQAEGLVNLPLINDRLGVRVVGYSVVDPGWIDDDDGRRNVNRTRTRGGRIALRLVPSAGWLMDVGATHQSLDARDTRYSDRPNSYRRDVPTAEPFQGLIRSYQSALTGPIGDVRLTIASGLTMQRQGQRYDLSRSGLDEPVASAMFTNRRSRVFDQEIRLTSVPGRGIDWVAGASLLMARTEGNLVELTDEGVPTRLDAASRDVTEAALFADGSIPVADRLRVGVGLRVFRATVRNDSFGVDSAVGRARTLVGVTPNVSLSYAPEDDRMLYVRFATAFRPGGLDPGNDTTRRYDADEVRTIDLGGRVRLPGGRLAIDGNLFLTHWNNIQTDYLSPRGWIATRNAGRATIPGAEWSVDWRVGCAWHVEAGALWQRPRRKDSAGMSFSLPLVPDVAARLAVSQEVTLGSWVMIPRVSADLAGATRLGLDGIADQRMPGRLLGRFGLVARSGALTLAIDIDNLLDTRGDAYAFGNSFVHTIRQYTPYRPRVLSLSVKRSF